MLPALALFALSPLLVRADDDPEPPAGGATLRQLRGKWTMTRRIFNGKETKPAAKSIVSYTFDGDKVTYSSGKLTYTAKVKIDTKTRPATLEMTREDAKVAPRKLPFKIEKGELYLVTVLGRDVTKEDFSGNNSPVMIFTREKK